MTSLPTLRLGTRASVLARTQTSWVADRLRERGWDVTVETISTRGDDRRDVPIAAIGGDGVFVRELEQALLDGRIDAAVHSLKDMPTAVTPGLVVAAVPWRATPFDALVGRAAARLEDLPSGAVVGTSSIRRVAQLAAVRPDLRSVAVRGNVDSRLRKLDAGEFDALLLAAAGLERLGLASRITQLLEPPAFWPAVSQGALAVQARADDEVTLTRVAAIDDADAHAAVVAERRMLADLAGGCLAPVGGWARRSAEGGLVLGGCVLDLDPATGIASRVVAEASQRELSPSAANVLGGRVAADLVAAGAEAMLARMRTRIA